MVVTNEFMTKTQSRKVRKGDESIFVKNVKPNNFLFVKYEAKMPEFLDPNFCSLHV